MTEKEPGSLEYLSGVFKGLSPGKQDLILDIARSLLKVQEDKNYLASAKTDIHEKR